MKLLVINGPNLNMLGIREPSIYGRQDYAALVDFILKSASDAGAEADCFQSNHEGDIVDRIQQALGVYDGIVINPAAYTHTSVALHDAIKACGTPTVEVHLSNVYAREGYRHESLTASAAVGQICGFGAKGYLLALHALGVL